MVYDLNIIIKSDLHNALYKLGRDGKGGMGLLFIILIRDILVMSVWDRIVENKWKIIAALGTTVAAASFYLYPCIEFSAYNKYQEENQDKMEELR